MCASGSRKGSRSPACHALSMACEPTSLLRPEWVVATSDVLEQSLTNGELDVAILVDPIGLREVRLSALGVQTNDWVGASGMQNVGSSPRQLAQSTIVTTPPPTAMYRTTIGWFAGAKITPEKTCLCSSLNAALQIVAAGTGIGIFPSKVVEAYPLKGALRTILTEPSLTDGRVFSRTAPPRMKRGRTRCYGRWSGSPMSSNISVARKVPRHEEPTACGIALRPA